jgi:uncharacterized short protein YbdD (DUF466 family)
MTASIAQRLRDAARVVRRVLGAPDYEGYLAHVQLHHPESMPLTREDFVRSRLEDRYNRPGARCC